MLWWRGTGMVRVVALIAAGAAGVALGLSAAPARAGVANAGIRGAPAANPLAGLPWGNYSGPQDEVFPAYLGSSGQQHRLLGLVARRPRVRWFGAWYGDDVAEETARAYIENVTRGNPDVLAQLAVFRLVPWEGAACQRAPTADEQASYQRWIDAFAAGIGSARVALILQPDLPFALCAPNRGLVLGQVAYAAQRFGALSHTTVYIDAGAGDWPSVAQAVRLLAQAGVGFARGFALNATHYDTTANEIRFGAQVVAGLARARVGGRHFVVNTAANGRGFTYQQYHGADFDNAAACRTRSSRRCVTLGIPPTSSVAARRWRLPADVRRMAGRFVDAYLWIGRPWLVDQADPFDLRRTLALAATTPF